MLPYYEIQLSDVGKAYIFAFGRHWSVTDFFGRILFGDIGKRVYRVRDNAGEYCLQVESDQQRDKRRNGA